MSRSARNTIGGIPTPPPIARHARPLAVRCEADADRAEHAQCLARQRARQRARADSGDLVEQFDPARVGLGAHDRQRPAHRQLLRAAQVHEAARGRARRAARRMQAQNVLLAVEVIVSEHRRVLEQDRAAPGCAQADIRPATASSTAMRTATPLLT